MPKTIRSLMLFPRLNTLYDVCDGTAKRAPSGTNVHLLKEGIAPRGKHLYKTNDGLFGWIETTDLEEEIYS